jgi:hypothetical protein
MDNKNKLKREKYYLKNKTKIYSFNKAITKILFKYSKNKSPSKWKSKIFAK